MNFIVTSLDYETTALMRHWSCLLSPLRFATQISSWDFPDIRLRWVYAALLFSGYCAPRGKAYADLCGDEAESCLCLVNVSTLWRDELLEKFYAFSGIIVWRSVMLKVKTRLDTNKMVFAILRYI